MREIKFRAWDGEKMQTQFVVVRPQAADCLGIMTDEKAAKKVYGLKEWKVMQYTGLKDKHGKEIYDGDILNIPTWSITKAGKIRWTLKKINVKQCGLQPNFCLVEWSEMSGWTGWGFAYHDRGEIIGNIYENPELIK